MKKIIMYFGLIATIIYMPALNTVYAENSSTSDPETLIFPNIIINEVNFKDAEHDWIELYVVNDMNSGKGGNIKGLKIQDDSEFFIINNNFIVHTGDFIVINFKNETENFNDNAQIVTFNILRTGLTGTTEQVIIKNNINEIIDAVCWANSSPTTTEIADFNEVVQSDQWDDINIQSCLNSEKINTNESIGRENLIDSNLSSDWKIYIKPTKGSINKIEEVIVSNSNATQDPLIKPFNTTNDNNEEVEEEDIIKEATTINTCETIYINEIFPNPSGPDTQNEWIEIINTGNDCIMDGWAVDDAEGGSKPFNILNENIPSHGFLLLPSWKTKIVLNNSEESVRLLSPDGIMKETVLYKKAVEDSSYAKNDKNAFEWTKKTTPLAANIFELNVEIEQEEEDKETTVKPKSTTKNSSKKQIKNGDLSDAIQLSEFMPNPKRTDKGNEWIEIYNNSEEKVNLGGWYLDTGENSSKKYIFDNTEIDAKEFIVLADGDLGFALKNSDGEIRLLDFEDKIIDSTKYASAADDSSYMKIKILNNDLTEYQWKWTLNSTKGEENQNLYKYKGEILSYDEKFSLLIIKKENLEELKINVMESGEALMQSALNVGSIIEVIVSKNEKNELKLEDYEILSEAGDKNQNNDFGILYIALSSLPPAGFLGYYGIKKFGLIKIITG